MHAKAIKMSFILQEELARIGNASDYELFILKSKIEKIINSPNKLKQYDSRISIGVYLTYFDVHTFQEDILLVTELGEHIKGVRQSDQTPVAVPPQAFDFEKGNPTFLNDRTPINQEWQLHAFQRVIATSSAHTLKGYFIKYSPNGCKLKLLGGNIVKLRPYAKFYEPNSQDIADFDRIEHDPIHQNHEYQKTREAMKTLGSSLEPLSNPIHYRKLMRLMAVRGYWLHHTEMAFKEVYGFRK